MQEATPAMKQYWKIKSEHPDCLLLFRMGDFYETFFEDAQIASKALDITLTKRGLKGGAKIPLAGIPYHALDNYLGKLVKAGIKVAICEQLEDPKMAKGVVKRGLTRIVTPGTLIESDLLDTESNNYIAAVWTADDAAAMAYADITTGELRCMALPAGRLRDELDRLSPAEVLYPETLKGKTVELAGAVFIPEWHFHKASAKEILESQFGVASLAPFGLAEDNICLGPLGALLIYLKGAQQGTIRHLRPPRLIHDRSKMFLDNVTVRNLELVKNIRGGKDRTLLDVIDNTLTPMGARMLKSWLLSPLMDLVEINRRLRAVEEMRDSLIMRSGAAENLGRIGDMERTLTRITGAKAVPRDMLSLKLSLSRLPALMGVFESSESGLLRSMARMPDLSALHSVLEKALDEDMSRQIRPGYNEELDSARDLAKNGKAHIARLQEKERERTRIKSLRIGFNRVFGYYFEVSRSNLSLVPEDYVRKQTTASGERFVTAELKSWEERVLGAEERIASLEEQLMAGIRSSIADEAQRILEAAQNTACIDCIYSLASAAAERGYRKPLVKEGFGIRLKGSRHPVVETITDSFIKNDAHLDEERRFMVLTGPNMAGKSTYMRQVALVSVMAQIGSFVPADEAEIGLVDRVFTRVGAHDDLTQGQSTFMVEMNEVSHILNNATERSLIIMDEIGRGTSTYDGISIAWSVALDIIERIRAKTLFATHYHVLTRLEKHESVRNLHASVVEDRDRIVFTRKIEPGGTDRSYGIHVAKLAGMPDNVIQKAKDIQFRLEEDERKRDLIVVEKRGAVLVKGFQRTLLDMDG